MGVRLLVRTTRALMLTDAGRSYYAASKRLLAEIDDIEAGLTAQVASPHYLSKRGEPSCVELAAKNLHL